jgi:hypothetical protein
LLSKSRELVQVEQDPVRVFASVQSCLRFEFQKRSQLFIGSHNQTLSVVAMWVSNPGCSPVRIHGWHAARIPTVLLRLSAAISSPSAARLLFTDRSEPFAVPL